MYSFLLPSNAFIRLSTVTYQIILEFVGFYRIIYTGFFDERSSPPPFTLSFICKVFLLVYRKHATPQKSISEHTVFHWEHSHRVLHGTLGLRRMEQPKLCHRGNQESIQVNDTQFYNSDYFKLYSTYQYAF